MHIDTLFFAEVREGDGQSTGSFSRDTLANSLGNSGMVGKLGVIRVVDNRGINGGLHESFCSWYLRGKIGKCEGQSKSCM